MTIFAWLIVGHVIGDFLLQNKWMAERKSDKMVPLLVHSFMYTAVVVLLAQIAGGLTFIAIAFLFVGHIVLDQRTFVDFWYSKISGNPDMPWFKLAIDQAWHIVILAIATIL